MRLITNPRPYNTTIETGIVTVKSQPINHQIHDETNTIIRQTDEQFLEGKFVCFAPTHYSAVIMGSTAQDNNRYTERTVLDASKVTYRLGKNLVRSSVDMALANGELTNSDSRYLYSIRRMCNSLIGTVLYDEELPDNTFAMTNKALGTVSSYVADINAKSTLTAVKLNSTNKDNVTASCINIGDNVCIILDGRTGLIKHILHPRYELVNGKQLPIHLQSLVHKSNPSLLVDREQFHVNPDDIVILGSAGFVDTLVGTEKIYSIATDQLVTVTGENVGKASQRTQVSFVQKEIDIDKLNARLQIIFAKLGQLYALLPPAFVIAEALIREAASISLVDRQKKQSFALGMRINIREYKKINFCSEEDQHKESTKQVRDEYATQCVNYNYGKIRDSIKKFREILFQSQLPTQVLVSTNNVVWDEFVKLISQKILQGQSEIHSDVSGKGKAHATASVGPELTLEQIHQLIINTLKTILQKQIKSQESVNEMMSLIAIIFLDEINDFASKLLIKPITVDAISRHSKLFSNSLTDKRLEFSCTTESLEKFLANLKNQWIQELENWVDNENNSSMELSRRFIRVIKKNLGIDEEHVQQDFWWMLRYIQYQDSNYQQKIKDLPYLKTTIAQFIERIRGIVPHEQIQEIHQYLTENNINESTPLHQIEPHFSLENKSYGDDTTVSVAYVLDPALELVRSMVIYSSADSRGTREQFWQELCNLYPDKKPTIDSLKQLIAKLRAEQQVGQREQGAYYDACLGGKKLDELKSQVVFSYTEEEILSLEHFFSLKTKLQVEVTGINNVTAAGADKLNAHSKLSSILLKEELSALEICGLYSELTKTQFDKLNKHRNSSLDYWLGITITRTWSTTLKVLREHCLTKLMTEVNQLIDNPAGPDRYRYIKALAILNNAVKQPLFKTHRNNSIFTGAYGDTLAVRAIRQRIIIITNALYTLQNSQDVGASIELRPLSPPK